MKVLGGEYEFPDIPDLPRIERVVDVGANVGAFAVWAYLKFDGPWIDGYEPNPDAARMCKANLPPGAVVHNVAITTEAECKLYLGGDWGWSSTIQGVNPHEESSIDVDIMHPRDLPPCDLLKIDAEGVEYAVMSFYKYWDRVKICMFEWHIESHRTEIERFVESQGLRCIVSRFDRVNLGQEIWVRTKAHWDEKAGRYVA